MKTLLILFSILALSACGTERVKYVTPDEGDGGQYPGGGGSPADPGNGGNGGGGSGGDEKPSYGEMQALLNNYCGDCHSNAGFMQSERQLRSSSVLQRVRSRDMPPNTDALPEEERELILAFF